MRYETKHKCNVFLQAVCTPQRTPRTQIQKFGRTMFIQLHKYRQPHIMFLLCSVLYMHDWGHAQHVLSESMLYRNDQVVILYSLILNDILKFMFINFYRSRYLRTPVTKQEQQELLTQALRRSFSTRETRRHYTAFKHREFFQFRRSRKSDL